MKDFLVDITKEAVDFKKDLKSLPVERQVEIIKYSCGFIPDETDLLARLTQAKQNKKQLIVKFGVDPTGVDLHLGHAVPLILLNRLQRMGHKIVFMVGNFTAKIGDPSGAEFTRKLLKKDEIIENFKDYKKQAARILDFDNVDIVYNADWLNNVKLPQLITLLNQIDIIHQFEREDLNNKINNLKTYTYAEMLYPILVGLDSVKIKPDLVVAGEDQMENLRMSQEIMKLKGLNPQCNLVTGILPGKNNQKQKMSKTLFNFISLRQTPEQMYEDLVGIPDDSVITYFDLLTELRVENINKLRTIINEKKINIDIFKQILAEAITNRLFGSEKTRAASLAYMQKIIKESKLTEIKVRHGSDISFAKTLATVMPYKEDEIREISKQFGISVQRLDGGFVDFLDDVEQKVEKYPTDQFYLNIKNKDIVKIIIK